MNLLNHETAGKEWEAHLRRANDLLDLARSTTMQGFWKAGQRRELIGRAQTHALIAAAVRPMATNYFGFPAPTPQEAS